MRLQPWWWLLAKHLLLMFSPKLKQVSILKPTCQKKNKKLETKRKKKVLFLQRASHSSFYVLFWGFFSVFRTASLYLSGFSPAARSGPSRTIWTLWRRLTQPVNEHGHGVHGVHVSALSSWAARQPGQGKGMSGSRKGGGGGG